MTTFTDRIIVLNSDGVIKKVGAEDSIELSLGNIIVGGIFTVSNNTFYGSMPSAPTIVDFPNLSSGDTYYDQTIGEDMLYDTSRNLWVSKNTLSINFGRKGQVPSGGYFRGTDGIAMSPTLGVQMPFDGVITGISISRTAPTSSPWSVNYSILENGSLIGSFNINGPQTSDSDTSLSYNFSSGSVVSIGIDPSSPNNSTENTIGKIFYKWRR